MNRIAAAMIAISALSSAAMGAEVTVATARGEATVTVGPETVVAYDVAAVDTLHALGVALAGVPERRYLPKDLDIGDAQVVGNLFEPDMETLAGIGPDLIVVGSRSAAQLDAVSRIAPAIDMTIGTDLIADAEARIDAFGAIFGKETEAEALKATLDEKLAALEAAGEGKGTALIVMTNGTKMAAYGTGSRFGWLHERTGMEPAITDLATTEHHGNVLTHEAIAQADPDWLFVLDRGVAVGEDAQSAEQTLKSPLVERTTAWREGQVVYIPAAELYIGSGGYGSLVRVIDALTEALTK